MDDMTIEHPVTGKARYRINKDLQVEDLEPCEHEIDIVLRWCTKCNKDYKDILNEQN